jgi:molecular chaperone DnaK (HSP70)
MNEEVKPVLTFVDKEGDTREVHEHDLNDQSTPIVQEISAVLMAQRDLQPAHEQAQKVLSHWNSLSLNINLLTEKLEPLLPSKKARQIIKSMTKEVKDESSSDKTNK